MKRWKKIFLAVFALNLLFFAVDSKHREAEASSLALTVASLTAGLSGVALTPIILGLAGAAAVGGIYHNRETIAAYGAQIVGDLVSRGINADDLVNADDYSVTVSEPLLNSFSTSVDKVPSALWPLSVSGIELAPFGTTKFPSDTTPGFWTMRESPEIPLGGISSVGDIYIIGDFSSVYVTDNMKHIVTLRVVGGVYTSQVHETAEGLRYLKFSLGSQPKQLTNINIRGGAYANVSGIDTLAISNAKIINAQDFATASGIAINTGITFGGTGTVADREAKARANIGGSQVIALNPNATLEGANWQTLTQVATPETPPVDEDIFDNSSILGSIQKVWEAIEGLPLNMMAAFAMAFNSVQETLNNLWEDAGKVISGIEAQTQTLATKITIGAQAQVDAINGGIDNINNHWREQMDNLRLGIDGGLLAVTAAINSTLADMRAGFDSINARGQNALDTLTGTISGTLTGIRTGISDMAQTLANGLTVVGNNALTLPQQLVDDLAEIKALVVPTDVAMSDYTAKMDDLRNKFKGKFEFIMLPIQSLKSLFASPKSLYDVSFTFMEQKIYILPRSFESSVNFIKPILTGAVVVSTFISIYRKFAPREVIGS